MQLSEYVIQDEPEYLARIKVYEVEGVKLPFLHLDFHSFTPTTFKKLLKAWSLFRATVKGPLYAISNGDDIDKWCKFCWHLNMQFFMNVTCPDGKIRPCFISKE